MAIVILQVWDWLRRAYREQWSIDDLVLTGDWISYIVWCSFRITGSVALAPKTRVETIMQIGGTGLQQILPPVQNQQNEDQDVTTVRKTIGSIFKSQGFFALWRGLRAIVLYRALELPLNWYITRFGRKMRKSLPKNLTGYAVLLNVGHLVTQALLYPVEVVRVKAAADLSPNKDDRTITGILNKVVNEDGFFSLFSGVLADLFGTVLIEGLGNLISTKLINYFNADASDWKVAALGTVGTLTAAAIGYPWLVVSRTMASQVGGTMQPSENAFECARDIYDKKGFAGFYGGFQITAFFIIVKGIILGLPSPLPKSEVKVEVTSKKREGEYFLSLLRTLI